MARQLDLIPTAEKPRLLKTKERQLIEAYLVAGTQVGAYRIVYPKASDATAAVQSSRAFKRIREKLDLEEYLDEFNLGKPRLFLELDRGLKATSQRAVKHVKFSEQTGRKIEEHEELLEVPDNGTRMAALRILADVHKGQKSEVVADAVGSFVAILQQAHEARMRNVTPAREELPHGA